MAEEALTPEVEDALKQLAAKHQATPELPEPEPSSPPDSATDDATGALKKQIDALNQARTMQEQAVIAQLAANERRQAWLEATPGAKENREALGHIHRAAIDAGLVDTSPEYFQFLESQLAALHAPSPAADLAKELERRAAQPAPEPAPAKARPMGARVSAPVSRDIPTSTGRRAPGKITLTPTEVEHARVSGISVEEYAKQKMRLAAVRASGEYSGAEDTRR